MALHVHSFFYFWFVVMIFVVVFFTAPSVSQRQATGSCNGILLSYAYTGGLQLPPNVSDPAEQPYRFSSTLTVLNNGLEELRSWRVFVGFQHGEWLVSASNAVLADGTSLPGSVENGTVLSGETVRDLKTAVATAGDLNQMQVRVDMVGTLLGVAPPSVPMPSSVTLANDGFLCGQPSGQGSNETHVCCTSDPNFKTNITTEEEFLPRQKGDLSITYDIIRTYDSDYWAEVTIANHNPLGRLDNWRLSWDWNNNEFIHTIKGAYPLNVDSSDCVFGPQGLFYKELDFSNVLNCERRPTIVDLPPTMFNNTDFGKIPFCCRNGTILPPTMDPSLSSSRFQIQVFKMPPNLNRSKFSPPHNWEIKGTLNPDYACGNPIRVSPSESPDPTHPPSNKSAIASWQVVCNITNTKREARKCCVSFSAYYNESVVPCNTCACGCSNPERTCSATSQAMLLPPEALLVPFQNRTEKARAWAEIQHLNVPNPFPCGDNCGVSINWHLVTDHRSGWSARITLFNWGEASFADWFAAVRMEKAAKGFEEVYSFNGSLLDGVDGTIFMQGKKGLNFLVAETDGSNPRRDPRVPGKQQSVISFTKKNTPGIDVVGGDGFPSKVFFNGEECSLPSVVPSSGTRMEVSLATMMFLVLFLWILFMRQ
ncbi:COBRA-like protein 7 [Glycine soja]|uniref:COBRA-like protein 7 n=2 Tax=Glycine soja TaxID=3848 RepID=A0A445IWN5_GLYSO|nr:COBRA-like protein 7 [Glycine soja]RZB90518.1 COBRA-like protein 7 [Glycine soja]